MPNDFLDKIMEDGYNLIITSKRFPKALTISNRLEMLEGMIEYFESKEEFEKCNILKEKYNNLKSK